MTNKEKIVPLYDYYMQCPECDSLVWYIQLTTDQKEILGIVCGNDICTFMRQNPDLEVDL